MLAALFISPFNPDPTLNPDLSLGPNDPMSRSAGVRTDTLITRQTDSNSTP